MPSNIVQYILNVSTGKARSEVQQLDKSVDGLQSELKKTSSESKTMSRSMVSNLRSLKLAVGAVGIGALTLGFKKAAEASFEFTRSTVDSINQLNDTAVKSGLTSDAVQAVIQAFEGAGLSAGSAESFMSRLPRTFADIAVSSTRAGQAAKLLGLSLKDAGGSTKNSDQLLRELTEKFQAIEDPTQRATAAFLLFGRSAGSFLQAFGQTAEFEKFLSFSEEFGIKTGPDASNAAAKFQETLSAITIAAKGTAQQVVTATGAMSFFQDILTTTGKRMAFLGSFLVNTQHLFIGIGRAINLVIDSFGGLGNFLLTVMAPVLSIQINLMGKLFDQINSLTNNALTGAIDTAASFYAELLGIDEALVRATNASDDFESKIKDILDGLDLNSKATSEARRQVEDLLRAMEGSGEIEGAKNKVDQYRRSVEIASQVMEKSWNSAITANMSELQKLTHEYERQISLLESLEFAQSDAFVKELAIAAVTEEYNAQLTILGNQRAFEIQAEKADKLTKSINGSVSALRSLTSGDVLGGLQKIAQLLPGNIGRIANIAGGVLSIASDLGEAGSKEQASKNVEESIRNQVKAIKIGLEALPDILLSVLPRMITLFAQEIAIALFTLPAEIARAIKDSLSKESAQEGGFGAAFSEEGRQARGQRLIDRLSQILSATQLTSGGRIRSAMSGMSFTGDRSGLALLHPNEYVIPASGQAPQAVNRDFASQSPGGMTININAHVVQESAIDELVRQIENRFQHFGGNRSSLFVGGVS